MVKISFSAALFLLIVVPILAAPVHNKAWVHGRLLAKAKIEKTIHKPTPGQNKRSQVQRMAGMTSYMASTRKNRKLPAARKRRLRKYPRDST
ncbi:hypothetical protein CPB83DRAFT_861060 [Crepidotus variabilis]|uniref:Uncharacterized protein n=1 Tax=Crepidotus variabilis TaxID=179855 RepID=A0A9P6JKU0_9AGAR|nr:hypothetical protein CPB83DRAFT_861060 [Crepidotus variabilis]